MIPDPEIDLITVISYAFQVSEIDNVRAGLLLLHSSQLQEERLQHIKSEIFRTELDLLNRLADLVVDFDPDVLTGWELQHNSWGYIQARSKTFGSVKFVLPIFLSAYEFKDWISPSWWHELPQGIVQERRTTSGAFAKRPHSRSLVDMCSTSGES